jgi:hypothetical protein
MFCSWFHFVGIAFSRLEPSPRSPRQPVQSSDLTSVAVKSKARRIAGAVCMLLKTISLFRSVKVRLSDGVHLSRLIET